MTRINSGSIKRTLTTLGVVLLLLFVMAASTRPALVATDADDPLKIVAEPWPFSVAGLITETTGHLTVPAGYNIDNRVKYYPQVEVWGTVSGIVTGTFVLTPQFSVDNTNWIDSTDVLTVAADGSGFVVVETLGTYMRFQIAATDLTSVTHTVTAVAKAARN